MSCAIAEAPVDLEAVTDLVATHGPFLFTKTGVIVGRPDTYDEWEAAFLWTKNVEASAMIWLGELLEYGKPRHGEKYSQALEASGYAEQTLKNATYFVRNVTTARRDPEKVPISVQMLVAPLPVEQQEHWLQKCEDEELTREELRVQIAQSQAKETGSALELWLLVKCTDAADQAKLADAMKMQGRSVRMTTKETKEAKEA